MNFNPCLAVFFRGEPTAIRHVLSQRMWVSNCSTHRVSHCLNRAGELTRQYTGDAGKDSLDGIRNFAGFGS